MNGDNKDLNHKIFKEQYLKILQIQYPNMAPDIMNDAVSGCLYSIQSGQSPSSVAILAAYDLGLVPTSADIIKYVFDRK